jgi:cellobiose-specific phosphotransferase system component IIC
LEYLGYIIVFYIGFYFYRLAENHNKNRWLFGFLGILFFMTGFLLYLIFSRFLNSKEYNIDNLAPIGVEAFFAGLILSIILFKIISFVWNRNKKVKSNSIDKIGKQ